MTNPIAGINGDAMVPEEGNRSTRTMSLIPTLRSVRRLTTSLLLLPVLAACGQGQSQPQAAAPPPPQVTVAKPSSKMIADQDEYVGRFVAVESIFRTARW
jgi:hypothetical protein